MTSTATCTFTESSNGTGAFSASYSGGTYVSSSQANLGQTNTLTPTQSVGSNAQTEATCSGCYYGQTTNPDAEGDAFVNGSLSGELTIGTANDIVVDGNISYATAPAAGPQDKSGAQDFCPYNAGGTNDSLGLIANEYVEINRPVTSPNGSVLPSCAGTPAALCDPSDGTSGISIDAAVLALNQSFVVNNYGLKNSGTEGPLDIYGSVQQYARGPVGTFGDNPTGYVKHYTWDPLLNYVSPPSYLVPSTASWDLTSINANAVSTPPRSARPSPGPSLASETRPPRLPTTVPAASEDCRSIRASPLRHHPPMSPPPAMSGAPPRSIGPIRQTTAQPSSTTRSAPAPAAPPVPGSPPVGQGRPQPLSKGLPPVSDIFTVTATNAIGTSDPSQPSASVISPTSPFAPSLVSAVGNTNDTVTVSWTAPSSAGSPITGYTVTPAPSCPTCTGRTVTGTTATITGLTVGGTYTFTVTATNAFGNGPAFGTFERGRRADQAGCTHRSQCHLQRQRPVGGVVDRAHLHRRSAHHPLYGDVLARQQNLHHLEQHHLHGERADQRHQVKFTVTATNAIGTGPASAPSATVTPSTLPGTPTGVSATAGNGFATVTWTAPASNGGAPITSYLVTSTVGAIIADLFVLAMRRPRAQQRDQLPVHRGGHQRFGQRNHLRSVQLRDTRWTPRNAHRCLRHLVCQRPVVGVVDRTVQQRRIGDHRLHVTSSGGQTCSTTGATAAP